MSKDFIGGEPTKRHKHRSVLKGVSKKDAWKNYQKKCEEARRLGIRPPISPIQHRVGARRIA